MKQKDLREFLTRAQARDGAFVAAFGSTSNPSARPAVDAATGRLGAYAAILDALAGDPVQLRILADG